MRLIPFWFLLRIPSKRRDMEMMMMMLVCVSLVILFMKALRFVNDPKEPGVSFPAWHPVPSLASVHAPIYEQL